MKRKRKYLVLLKSPDKKYYIEEFFVSSKRKVPASTANKTHTVEAILKHNEKNIVRIAYMEESLNRLNKHSHKTMIP